MALINERKAAEEIGVTPRALRDMRYRGKVPFIRISRKVVRYSTRDLEQFIEERRVPADDEEAKR